MKNKLFFWMIFFFIVAVAVFLRTYTLASIPPGINRDEGSIAYTAFSLLQTGKDEYGRFFPISFESFGDWKLPLYIYLTTGFVWLLGINEVSVRVVSVIAGIVTVVLAFFLAREVFKNDKLALVSMFFVAIAPWHIHLSRVESESNTAVMLCTLGYLFFLLSIRLRKWLIIPSAVAFALTYFTYAGNHIFTTLLLGGVGTFYIGELKKNKWSIPAGILFLVLFGFIVYVTLFQASKTKLSGIGIFGDPAVVHAKIELPRTEHNSPSELLARVVHNRVVYSLEKIGQNYINSFSPQFLFIKGGDNNAHNIQQFGNMYLAEAPLLFLGLFALFKVKKTREIKTLLWWFFIAPIAASITKDAPHTNRMFAIFPILPFVTAFGVNYLYELKQKSKNFLSLPLALLFVFSLFLFLNIVIYVDRYFVHFPRNEVKHWGLGYKQLATILEEDVYKGKKVVISHPEYSPYIFLLFYTHYPPVQYQKEAIRYPYTEDGFLHVKGYGRYTFREIDWGVDIHLQNTVLVDFTREVPISVIQSHAVSTVSLPNAESMFTIVTTK